MGVEHFSKGFWYCIYCRKRFERHALDQDEILLAEHVKSCPLHPMRKLEQQIQDMNIQIGALNKIIDNMAKERR